MCVFTCHLCVCVRACVCLPAKSASSIYQYYQHTPIFSISPSLNPHSVSPFLHWRWMWVQFCRFTSNQIRTEANLIYIKISKASMLIFNNLIMLWERFWTGWCWVLALRLLARSKQGLWSFVDNKTLIQWLDSNFSHPPLALFPLSLVRSFHAPHIYKHTPTHTPTRLVYSLRPNQSEKKHYDLHTQGLKLLPHSKLLFVY